MTISPSDASAYSDPTPKPRSAKRITSCMPLYLPGYAPPPWRSRLGRCVSNGRSLIGKPRVTLSPRGDPRRERCSRALLGQVPDVLELRRQRDDLLVLDLVE